MTVLDAPRATAIDLPRVVIEGFCRRWQIAGLALFGPIPRDDFGPGSDIDTLVSFSPGSTWSLMDRMSMKDELQELLGREIDLESRRGIVVRSRNRMRRDDILGTAGAFYVASPR